MNLTWTSHAWEEYIYWQETDKKIVKRINDLLKECLRTPFEGKGKPEPLKHDRKGYWSRRITDEHRLIYKIENDKIIIASFYGHYNDK